MIELCCPCVQSNVPAHSAEDRGCKQQTPPIYHGESLPGRWISDRDVYASGATPTTGAQVVYELAAPLTYQLTPQQLATLAGYNAVSTDAGTLSVTYRADPALSLGG